MATLDIKDSVELLADFIEKAIIEEHSSFVGVAYIPAGDAEFVKSKHQLLPPSNTTKEDLLRRYQKRRNLPEPPDIHAETVDLSGKTLAHVMSITKAIMGLLWAYYIYNKDGEHEDLRGWLLNDNDEKSKFGFHLSHRHIHIPKIRNAHVRKGLTQTSGVIVKDTDGYDMFKTLLMMSHHDKEADATLTTFDSLLREGLMTDVPIMKNEFHYSDKMTQVTSMTLEDMEKRRRNNFRFLIKNEIPKIFFPPALREAQNIKDWPTIPAGYTVNVKKGQPGSSSLRLYKTEPLHVENSLGFWGIQMTGQQMVEFGAYLLTHHLELLTKIYDDKEFYTVLPPKEDEAIQDEARKLGGIHATRANWHYSYFWWIPRYEDDPDNDKYKWIAAIGHQGQFILLELTQRWVFVRQHFVHNKTFQNVDMDHITSHGSDRIRYAKFCYDAFVLVKHINYINKKN